MDAKQTMLSRIVVGDTILAAPGGFGMFGFGRPKDTSAKPCVVTAIDAVPDQWTGKVYTVLLADGRKSAGRYGTTHVYRVEGKAPKVKKGKADPHLSIDAQGQATVVNPAERFAPEVELDLAVSGKRRVQVAKDGTMTVQDWTGGEVTERTPKGRLVRIAADGVLTILEDFPEEDGQAEAEQAFADAEEYVARPAVTDDDVANSDRCHGCKGFGVVRKRGGKAGKPYRTLAGAEQATANGNAETCPTCRGATLILRTA